MAFFASPTSYRLNAVAADDYGPSVVGRAVSMGLGVVRRGNDHGSHPALGHLILLVFEAVLEVVCVSLPGYIVARQGMFDQDKQKFVANLNVALFTPCLSMYRSPSTLNFPDQIFGSLYEAGFAAYGKQAVGSSRHPSDICGANRSLLPGFRCRLEGFQV
jgi:hypothetical protein